MKKLFVLLLLALCVIGVNAQEEKSLYEQISGVKKKTDKFNLYSSYNSFSFCPQSFLVLGTFQ